MRLNSLRLTNFRQHAESYLEFDTGLTGIIGPNGAGKSTILEAIAWALYGNAAARATRETIRFIRAAPRASVRVELDFELGSHRYRVVRGLHSAELYLDGAAEPIANSTSAVTELVQRRIGMSREEFFHTYFTGQKELNVMSAMGPAERAQFLSRVLGYERLRVAQEAVRDQRKMALAQLNAVRSTMPDADAVQRMLNESATRRIDAERELARAGKAQAEAEGRLAAIGPTWAAAQSRRERYSELSSELRVTESELNARLRDVERLGGELQAIAEARDELTALTATLAPMADLPAEYARLESLARDEGRRQTLLESLRALDEELVVRRERRQRLATAPQVEETVTLALEAKRREVDETLGELEVLRTAWVRDRQEAETKRDALRLQYAELKKQREKVVEVGEDGTCPTCTRVLGESFRSVLDQIDEQLDTIAVDGRYYGARLAELEPSPPGVVQLEEQRDRVMREAAELEGRLARVRSEVQELGQVQKELVLKEQRYETWSRELAELPTGYDQERHEAVKRESERVAPLYERATRLSTQLEREAALLAEMREAEGHAHRLSARLTELNAQRAELQFSDEDYASVRSAQELASADAQTAAIEMAAANSELKSATRALESATQAQSDLQRAQDTERRLQQERRLHEELDRAFTDLRTDLNHALRPDISELASGFLGALTDHRYSELELDDQYNIVVMEDGRSKPVISGGEEDIANLVLRLAISQMIAERAGQTFSLLILDEIFGSLDEVRRHNVVELLRRLHDRFEQVILITHIEAVREGLDRVIAIGFDEETGSSVVRSSVTALPDPELFDGAGLAGAGVD